MARATNVKNILVTCALRIFSRRLLRCPITEFLSAEEYVTQLFQSNENTSITSLHISYICCAVEPLLMFVMSSDDFATSPESSSTCPTKTGKKF